MLKLKIKSSFKDSRTEPNYRRASLKNNIVANYFIFINFV